LRGTSSGRRGAGKKRLKVYLKIPVKVCGLGEKGAGITTWKVTKKRGPYNSRGEKNGKRRNIKSRNTIPKRGSTYKRRKVARIENRT